VTAIPGEFDGTHDESQPLPPEDRLWRHPSELDPLSLDPNARRRHRLLSHPARRSVLTAGIVGALLASSVTAIVTHFADSLGSTVSPPATTLAVRQAASDGPVISKALAAKVRLVSAAMATVEVTSAKGTSRSFALVIRSNGILIAPAFALAGADGITVTLANGDFYVGQLISMNIRTGLAMLRINGASRLPTVTFSKAPIANGSWTLAVGASGETAVGSLRSSRSTIVIDGHRMISAMSSDISAASGPAGRPLLTSSGTVEAVITDFVGTSSVVAPAWLVEVVAKAPLASVSAKAWLGIRCVTNKSHPAGVRIVSIAQHSSLVTAGLGVGDVIVAVDRTPVSTVSGLRARLYGLRPGTRVTLTVDKNGSLLTRVVKLIASPNE
jgi:S1-C subfamily serine protease